MSEADFTTPSRLVGEPVYIVEPYKTHTHTFILLHGLGSNGEKFGKELLDTGVTSGGLTLAQLLPGARFIFPTSKRRRSSAFRRLMLTQWFDITRLEDPSYRKERQLQGLAESAEEILDILTDEAKKVSPQNLVIGGLSQGCAMSLAILLCLDQPIGGYIGMSGYLTFQQELENAIADEEHDDDNPFSRDDNTDQGQSGDVTVKAQSFKRDLLSLSLLKQPAKARTAYLTPVFLGHGMADEKVPCSLGEAAARTMRQAGYSVEWKCYTNQGHWYKIPDEIDDIVNFINSQVGWESSARQDSINMQTPPGDDRRM